MIYLYECDVKNNIEKDKLWYVNTDGNPTFFHLTCKIIPQILSRLMVVVSHWNFSFHWQSFQPFSWLVWLSWLKLSLEYALAFRRHLTKRSVRKSCIDWLILPSLSSSFIVICLLKNMRHFWMERQTICACVVVNLAVFRMKYYRCYTECCTSSGILALCQTK